MRNFVANFGEGAYLERGFGDQEDKVESFGFNFGDDEEFEEWEPEDKDAVHDLDYKAHPEGLTKEFKHSAETPINGLTEYGYGFWMRFLWNGPT